MRAIMSGILMIVLSVASVTAGIHHYCDYLGSIRVIVNTDGDVEQTVDYLSTGIPIKGGKGEIIDDRLHTGKQYLSLNGSLLYDNVARYYSPVHGRFTTPDALSSTYPHISHYAHCANNPLSIIDPTGMWNVYVHLEKDRSVSGYGVAIVTNNEGEEIFQFQVRAEGVKGRDRLKADSDTPLGIYDIPDNNAWISGGNRKAYGPNPRLNMTPEKGEIVESGRDLIRIHGGRQESYNSHSKRWEKDKTPQLNKTEGCLRAFDDDMKKFKQLTDNLEKNNPTEKPEKVYILDDLDEFQKTQNK